MGSRHDRGPGVGCLESGRRGLLYSRWADLGVLGTTVEAGPVTEDRPAGQTGVFTVAGRGEDSERGHLGTAIAPIRLVTRRTCH